MVSLSPAYRPGDIIIADGTVSHCAIVIGEKVKYSSGVRTDWMVLHATGFGSEQPRDGIKKSDVINMGAGRLFRPRAMSDAQAQAVQDTALRLHKASSSYGTARAVFAWAGSTGFGTGAFGRLQKYKERLSHTEHQGAVKNVFCSEFVILCYQLAFLDEAQKTRQTNPLFINLDAKHSYPKHLRQYLRTNATVWEEGDFPP
ncbi:hypothetical protein ACCD06_18060 [Azospirillum sp. CT11-132]|uniref:hypothetical protein n=1 Tax=unclassified Azospirillum TaxID=2630922 RepID=UPI0010A9E6F3|nr:hypothetical protein [Azospirillum sp. TSA2s]QCG97788.1 hypothetical protein E6C67_29125 [Azospirillum sp. TSA2s]